MKKKWRNILIMLLLLGIVFSACQQNHQQYEQKIHDPQLYSTAMKQLTDVIVHDIFSPPVASRIYAYACIAGYEVMAHGDSNYRSLAGQLHGLAVTPAPPAGQKIDFPFAAMIATSKVGKALIFSEDRMEEAIEGIKQKAKESGMPRNVFDQSVTYGEQMANAILDWSKTDHYAQTRSASKYTVTAEEGRWLPTPPSYMAAIEPHWNQIRPFVLDSANEFIPPRPPRFDMKNKNSDFYKITNEVYSTVKEITDALNTKDPSNENSKMQLEKAAIADFWDCNPYKVNTSGHVMFATKKITPGGHWINICGIVCKEAKADFAQTTYTYAHVAIALADAFISCWDEKFRSNFIRPETVINKYIDENWKPYLQTPPFPEYTSGHSVISTAAATVLTSIYGPDFHFKDTSELEFGLAARSYPSFFAASQEAAISRLYGGIHYRPAIEKGVEQGKKVGELVVTRVKMKVKSSKAL